MKISDTYYFSDISKQSAYITFKRCLPNLESKSNYVMTVRIKRSISNWLDPKDDIIGIFDLNRIQDKIDNDDLKLGSFLQTEQNSYLNYGSSRDDTRMDFALSRSGSTKNLISAKAYMIYLGLDD